MRPIPIAFYAPLKSPDHPSPSGDRTMARLLLRALRGAGYEPAIASRLRTFEPAGDPDRQAEIAEESRQEAERLLALCRAEPRRRPRLWLTYHNYYKAPDHLGPAVSRGLGIPYLVAEASSAPKRASGPWSLAHRAAEAAIDAASLIVTITDQDRDVLMRDPARRARLVDLPPFVDVRAAGAAVRDVGSNTTSLLAVAMMREGDKLASYRLLAAALGRLTHLDWRLDIVGDGPARLPVEACFVDLGNRVTFHGELSRDQLDAAYAAADLFAWPAVNEAYGMVLLEAQAAGCPVVAGGYGGVPNTMKPGVTGLMPAPGDEEAFAAALRSLMADPEARHRMGRAAGLFIAQERTVEHASATLRAALNDVLRQRAA